MDEASVSREDQGRESPSQALVKLLQTSSPEELVSQLTDNDPCRLQELCAVRLRDRAILIDLDRLFQHAIAQVAVAARGYSETTPIRQWLVSQVDLAIAALVQTDAGEESEAVPYDPSDDRYLFMWEAFGVHPARARWVAVRFNRLDDKVRELFFVFFVEDRSIPACLEEGFGPYETLQERVRLLMRTLYAKEDDSP